MGAFDLPDHANIRMRRSRDAIKRNSEQEILRRAELSEPVYPIHAALQCPVIYNEL